MALPLKGLKVLDFSTLLPGPYATQLLADMGAEVLRVESPSRPDLLKMLPPFVGKVSAAHASINRNKKSIALDLKHEFSIEIIHELLKDFDVIVEQFRPGVMERLGLGYETLAKVQPKLIYCSITGYGQTGAYKHKAGHDINYLALSGLASYSGRKESGPTLSSMQIADVAGGSHHAVMAILASVIERQQTKLGQYLDISMADAAFSLNTMFGANALASKKDPECGTEMLNGGMFYDYYETADQRYLSIGSLEPVFCKRLLEALGLQELMSKVSNNKPEVQQDIKKEIAHKIKQQDLAVWVRIFDEIDACVEPVLTVNEAADSNLFKERNMLVEADDAEGKKIMLIKSALPFKNEGRHYAGRPLGADTKDVLRSLGRSEQEITELTKSKSIKL